MRLLWLVSNWKRTGPVEPSLFLAAALAKRGHRVEVASGRPPRGKEDEVQPVLDRLGLPRVLTDMRLAKHAFVLRDVFDARRLARWIARERPDAVVTTLPNDHRLAVAALRKAGAHGSRPRLARLWFGSGETPVKGREVRALRATPRIVVFGVGPASALTRHGVPASALVRGEPALDVAGLRALAPVLPGRGSAGSPRPAGPEAGPAPGDPPPGPRTRFGVPAGTFLVGIVARIQTHRRWELLWDALERLKRRGTALRLLVVGRGTKAEELAHRPVAERGLGDVVTFAGYLRGAEYAAALAGMDAQLFLVPGSDPTCRALREGMALGVASVATRRGLLPEIVADGETGLLVDETAEGLAETLERLAADPALRARLGAAAAERARARWDAPGVAERFEKDVLTGS